jgi:hypothetical protein
MAVGVRQVGEFILPRPMIRSVRNPLDKATIISIFPREITEVKETIEPRTFHIEPGTFKNPSLTVVGSASWWRDVDADQPLLEIPISAVQVAHSVITDFCNGMLGCDMVTALPGLFYVPGELGRDEILTKYKLKMVEVQSKQNKWFDNLIKLADSLWARSNGNPLVIWDEMRLAAQERGAEKVWIKDFQLNELVKCFACGSLRNPEFPICSVCKNVDTTHPRAKDIKIAAI